MPPLASPSGDPRAVVGAVATALQTAPVYQQLPEATRRDLMAALSRIGAYLGSTEAASRGLAEPFSPRGGGTDAAPSGGSARGSADGSAGGSTGTTAPTGTTGRVGELARATLGAIDFPSFVSALIKGTFQAIVDATIQQMEAYATLLQEVAKTVDDYMQDNVTEDSARDYLTDRYPSVLTKGTTGSSPSLQVNLDNPTAPLPTFFSDLGFDMPAQIDPTSIEEVIVPAARMTMAEQRHQTLATMVLLGLNRIIVNEGEIAAKLQFHIDASETTALTFDSTQTSMGNMAGTSGRSTFSGNGIMVNTTSLNAQSDLNLRTDLTGEVRVKFSSDVLPLSSFANSAVIQLINSNATVPSSVSLPQPVGSSSAPADGSGIPSDAASAPVAATAGTPAPAAATEDPWRPSQ